LLNDIYTCECKLKESCFPISNKSQITVRLFSFLKNDLIGFEEKSAIIEEMGLSLIPSYMVDYSINAVFKTSVGVIHSINESSSIFLSDRGEPINPIVTNPLLSQKYRIYTVTPDALGDVKIFEKGEFTKLFKEVKSTAKDVLTRVYTETVVYYGANNRRYEKTCIPKQKDINILDIKQVYIPFWNIVFSMLKNKYAIVGIESSSGLTILPSNIVDVKADSGVKVYPDICMICSRIMKTEKFVCTECGMITCSKDRFKCKLCGKQICREHTSFRRKFLILKEKYCPQCALSTIGK